MRKMRLAANYHFHRTFSGKVVDWLSSHLEFKILSTILGIIISSGTFAYGWMEDCYSLSLSLQSSSYPSVKRQINSTANNNETVSEAFFEPQRSAKTTKQCRAVFSIIGVLVSLSVLIVTWLTTWWCCYRRKLTTEDNKMYKITLSDPNQPGAQPEEIELLRRNQENELTKWASQIVGNIPLREENSFARQMIVAIGVKPFVVKTAEHRFDTSVIQTGIERYLKKVNAGLDLSRIHLESLDPNDHQGGLFELFLDGKLRTDECLQVERLWDQDDFPNDGNINNFAASAVNLRKAISNNNLADVTKIFDNLPDHWRKAMRNQKITKDDRTALEFAKSRAGPSGRNLIVDYLEMPFSTPSKTNNGFPNIPSTFFGREQEEKSLKTAIQTLLQQNKAGALVVWGTGGVGKTALVGKIVTDDEFLAEACPDLYGVVWINVSEQSQAQIFVREKFYATLIDELRTIAFFGQRPQPEPNANAILRFLNETLSPKRILLILDDTFCNGVVKSLTDAIGRHTFLRCVAVTRNSTRAMYEAATFSFSEWELKGLSDESMFTFISESFKLSQPPISLQSDQIKRLVTRCYRLPLVANVINNHFKSVRSAATAQIIYQKMLQNPGLIASSQVSVDKMGKNVEAMMTVSELLLHSPEFREFRKSGLKCPQPDSVLWYYFTFLLFARPGIRVPAIDLRILWKLNDADQVKEKCQNALEATLLEHEGDNGSTCYVVHELLHYATQEVALKQSHSSNVSALKETILNLLAGDPQFGNFNPLLEATRNHRVGIVELFVEHLQGDQLQRLSTTKGNDSDTVLALLADYGFAANPTWLRNNGRATETNVASEMFSKMFDKMGEMDLAALGDAVLEKVELSMEPSISKMNKWHQNMFLVAAHFGHTSVVKEIVKHPRLKNLLASVDKENSDAVILAAYGGHLDIVEVTMKTNKFSPNNQNSRGQTALMLCARYENCVPYAEEISKNNDLNLSITDRGGDTALHYAARMGRSGLVKFLVRRRADLTAVNAIHETNPLEEAAARYDRFGVAYYLMTNGGGMCEKEFDGFLEHVIRHIAVKPHCVCGCIKAKQYALENKAHILKRGQERSSAKIKECMTELHLAAQEGNVEKIRTLLKDAEWKQRINEATNLFQTTPLLLATELNRIEAVQVLLEQEGIMADLQDHLGDTALIRAAWKGRPEIAEMLIEKQAKVDEQNIYGYTALIAACETNQVEIVKALIVKGAASVNVQNRLKETALIRAVQKSNDRVVELLLEKGADVNLKTNGDQTALSIAKENGNTQIVTSLLQYGAIENETISTTNSSLRLSELTTPSPSTCSSGSGRSRRTQRRKRHTP